MKVLIAFERSGIVRDAFREAGHDAMSCDLEPTDRPGPHHQGDARPLMRLPWDLVIAHPPCTYLTHSRGRLRDIPQLIDAACLFNDCYCANAPKVAVENPMPYKVARVIVGEPDYMVHPFHFGNPYLKKTYWWTRGLPPLLATSWAGEEPYALPAWVGGGNQSPKRAERQTRSPRERAQFWHGMAAAMAQQWGSL